VAVQAGFACTFALRSIIRHHGPLTSSGHYTTDARVSASLCASCTSASAGGPSCQCEWLHYDDSAVSKLHFPPPQAAVGGGGGGGEGAGGGGTALQHPLRARRSTYMLLYQHVSAPEG
jgi:hypothetical protein